MKNTLENKIKFFTQYWKQNILRHEGREQYKIDTDSLKIVERDYEEDYYIELKSAKNLKRKHLKKCQFNLSKDARVEINGEYWIGCDKNNYYLGEGVLLPNNIDYLRSEGFAVPWNKLSVEKLLEYGWIKIVD